MDKKIMVSLALIAAVVSNSAIAFATAPAESYADVKETLLETVVLSGEDTGADFDSEMPCTWEYKTSGIYVEKVPAKQHDNICEPPEQSFEILKSREEVTPVTLTELPSEVVPPESETDISSELKAEPLTKIPSQEEISTDTETGPELILTPAEGEMSPDMNLPVTETPEEGTNVDSEAVPDAPSEPAASEIINENIDLENTVTTDEEGTVILPEDALIDFIFPETVNEIPVNTISAEAFTGCEYFRTVIIPATITEIGADAFADCPNLKQIILLDRLNTEDMVLGENWAGDTPIEFGLIQTEDEIVPEEELTEEITTENEDVISEEDMTPNEEHVTEQPSEGITNSESDLPATDEGTGPEQSEPSEEASNDKSEAPEETTPETEDETLKDDVSEEAIVPKEEESESTESDDTSPEPQPII